MIRSVKVQELVDWFLIHLNEWTEPVTMKDLAEVESGYTRNHLVAALKFLAAEELIYKYSEDTHGLIHWLPTRLRPVCPIQELICRWRVGDGV